jgi:NADH:ubiquinone oxidoreductase subunit 3 (subunit A)
MTNLRAWPVATKFLVGALILYSALLCGVSLTSFIQSLYEHWSIKAEDIVLQSLMTLFLPAVIVGLSRARLASGLLFVGVAIDLALLCFLSNSTGEGTAIGILSSLVFLGCPMLGAAILFRHLSRQPPKTGNPPASILKL